MTRDMVVSTIFPQKNVGIARWTNEKPDGSRSYR